MWQEPSESNSVKSETTNILLLFHVHHTYESDIMERRKCVHIHIKVIYVFFLTEAKTIIKATLWNILYKKDLENPLSLITGTDAV